MSHSAFFSLIVLLKSFEFTGHYTEVENIFNVSLTHALVLYYFLVSLDLVSNFNTCVFFLSLSIFLCLGD